MDSELTHLAPMLVAALVLGAIGVVGLIALERDRLRRVLLALVDPRPLALVRVGFGLCLLLSLIEVSPLNLYLFSDEGLLTSPAVPQVHGQTALHGLGDGVRAPAGFVDAAGALDFLVRGRWSLVYFWDSPTFVRGYFAALLIACGLFILGWRTRLTAIVTWLLYIGMLRRGDAHWGGEQVFCGFMFLLVLARCGEAYSVDNILRCRVLRARGLLSEPAGAGDGAGAPPSPEHPQGLAAIYRRVPAWPQALIAIQLAICYGANGWSKWGAHWVSGDALLYTLQLEQWTRFDWQPLLVALGAWPLRIAAWSVLWWERLFPLMLIGLWLEASARHPGRAPRGAARVGVSACWLVLAAALTVASLSGDLVAKTGDPSASARAITLGMLAAAITLTVVFGRRLVPARLTSPRLWLGLGAGFHLLNFVTLNVGMFATATLATYLACGAGPGAVRVLQRLARGLARFGVPVPKHMSVETAIGAEDPRLPHLRRDDAALPGLALALAGLAVLVAAVLALLVPRHALAWWHGTWLLLAVGLAALGHRIARRASMPTDGAPWAYGPAGRLAAGGLFAYHTLALMLWQLPKWPTLPYRDDVRALVSPWMGLSFTKQAWSMFAPDVPRSNHTLRTRIIDAAGVEHDQRTELQHRLVRPSLMHDRWHKIDGVVSKQRPELTRWHARWLCRRWQLEHGETAAAVVLERLTVATDLSLARGELWQRAQVKPLLRIDCATEPFAQLDDELRARHGLPPAAPGSLHFTWPTQARAEDSTPLWLLLALLLAGGLATWAREDRRRHVTSAATRRQTCVP